MIAPQSEVTSASLKLDHFRADKRSARKRRQSRLGRSFRALSFGLAIAALATAAQAATYTWDNNGATPGFGTAGDTWSATTSDFSTDPTGATAPTGTVATTTADALNFGTATLGLGTGTITVSGTVGAGSITFGAASGAITLSGGTINLGSATASGITNNSGNIQIFSSNIALGVSQTWNLGVGATFNNAISGAFATVINSTGVVNLAVSNSGDTGVATTIGSVSYVESFRLNTGITVIGTSTSLGSGVVDFRSTLQAGTALTGANKLLNTFVLANSGSNGIISGTNNIELGGALNVSSGSPAVPTLFFANGGTTTISGTVSLSDVVGTAKGLTLDVAGAGVTISGAIQNFTTAGSGAASGITKTDTGTLTLTGTNTYTGATTVNAGTLLVGNGTSGSLAATSALVFSGTSTLNRVQAATAATQTFANLTFTAGAGTVQSTYGAGTSGSGGLTFTLATGGRTAGATGNFVVSGGTNGSTNKIVLTGTTANTFVNKGEYFNGADFAFYDAGGFVRAPIYGTDTGTSAVNTIGAGTNVELTATQAAQASVSLTTLNLSGGGTSYANSTGATLTLVGAGLIKSGGGAVGTISGGTGLTTGGTGELVIRTDTASDLLDIQTPILATSTGGLTKSGAGTLTLSAANAYTGVTTLNEGTLSVTGSIGSTGNTVVNGGILSVSGSGAINPLSGTTSLIVIGGVSGAQAALYQSGASSVVRNSSSGAGGFQIGGAVNSQGYFNLAGGTVNVGGEFDPGGSSGGANTFGQFDMSGGTMNLGTTSTTTAPYFLPVRGAAGEVAVVNISGGTVQINSGNTVANSALNGLAVGLGNVGNLNSTITLSGTGQFLTPSLTTKLNDTNFGAVTGNATNVSVLNMNGGTLQTLGFGSAVNASTFGSNNAVINFNGGTIKAGSAGNTAFMGGLGAVNVFSGGGTLDNNGQAITVTQPLLAASGTGVTSLAVSTAGAGYIVPPRVVFSGGTTVGGFLSNTATGYATIDPSTGAVTGIVITSPGSYTSTAGLTVQLLGGGGGTTSASLGALTLNGGNTSGGMTFQGGGTTTLTGVNSYTGATAVNAGTLRVSGSLASGSTVSVASAATLAGGAGNTAGTNTIGGATTSSGTIAPGGVGTIGTLFFGNNLSLNGGNFNLDLNGTNNATGGTTNDLLAITGNLSATGTVIVSPAFSATPAVNTVYTIATYGGTLSGAGSFAAGSRAITIGNTGASNGTLTLTYTGATSANLRWNSTTSGVWDVVTTPNWFNLGTSTQDFFYQGDATTFDDTPGLQTAITINTAVLPSSVVVNSNTNNYSFTGTAGIGGTASLTKSGTSTLTLNTVNSYTGGTIINGGVVSIAADANLGATASGVTFNGGTLLTTAGITNTHAFTIGAGGGTINVSTGGQYFLNTANTLTGSGPLTLIGGNGTLTVGVGNLRVAQTNTYSGAVSVNTGGIFEYGVAGAVATGATFNIGNQGELALQGSPAVTLPNAITISGGTNSVLSFENGAGGIYSGAITLNATATIGLRDWYNYATVRSGTISGVLSGAGGLSVNSGTGTGGVLTLSGPNTFDGAVAINASTVAVTNVTGLGSTVGGTTVASGGALDVRVAVGAEPVTISGTGVASGGALITSTGTGSLSGPVTLAANSSIGGAGALTLSGAIGDGGSGFGLTKIGAGTTTLTGTSTYTGATTISVGTLQVGDGTTDGSITSSANIVDNAALVYNRSTGSNFTYGGVISGTGTVTKTGAGTQTLSGTNSYSGGTIINGTGTLVMANTSALGASTGLVNISGGATLDVATAGGDTAYNLTEGTNTTGFTLVSDVATPGAGINHTLGNLTPGNGNTINVVQGANVTSGTASITLGAVSLTSGFGAGTTTFNPTTANLILGSASSASAGAKTLALAGTSSGNQITGVIADGTSGSVIVTKSGASTWTLSGANTYTGVTTVTAGTLLIDSTGGINGSATVNVTGGALTLQTATGLSDTGTLSLASGTTFNLNAVSGMTSEVIGNLIINGVTQPTGTYTASQLMGLEQPGDNVTFGSAFGETLTIGAVPEPTTVLGGLLLVAMAGYRERRRLHKGWQAARRSF